jgi:hypothetical protein
MTVDALTRNMRKHKAALTRAKNTKDSTKVIAACDAALVSFDTHGWPDCWSLWARERRDAEFALQRAAWS